MDIYQVITLNQDGIDFFFHNLSIWCPCFDREWTINRTMLTSKRGILVPEKAALLVQPCFWLCNTGITQWAKGKNTWKSVFFVCSISLTTYLVLDLFLLTHPHLLDAEEWLNDYLFKNWKYFLSLISRRAFKEFSGLKQI